MYIHDLIETVLSYHPKTNPWIGITTYGGDVLHEEQPLWNLGWAFWKCPRCDKGHYNQGTIKTCPNCLHSPEEFNMTTIKWTGHPPLSLSQTTSPVIEMALLGEHNEVLHKPVMCKDYINDVFWGEAHKKDAGIYGFKWKYNSHPCVMADTIRMGVRNKNGEKIGKHSVKFEAFLNYFEDKLGIPHSTVEPANKDKDILIHFNKKWRSKSVLISAFTFLIRIGLKYDGKGVEKWVLDFPWTKNGSTCQNDLYTAWSMRPVFQKIFKGTWKLQSTKLPSFDKITSVGTAHNNGFLGQHSRLGLTNKKPRPQTPPPHTD